MTVLSVLGAKWKTGLVTNIFWATSVWLAGTMLSWEGSGYKDESHMVPTLRSHSLVGETEWGKMPEAYKAEMARLSLEG